MDDKDYAQAKVTFYDKVPLIPGGGIAQTS
jgi:hypothetical protein